MPCCASRGLYKIFIKNENDTDWDLGRYVYHLGEGGSGQGGYVFRLADISRKVEPAVKGPGDIHFTESVMCCTVLYLSKYEIEPPRGKTNNVVSEQV